MGCDSGVQGSVSGWRPGLKIGFDWVCFSGCRQRYFFHKSFPIRGLGQFWVFANWVCFAKSMLVILLRPAGFRLPSFALRASEDRSLALRRTGRRASPWPENGRQPQKALSRISANCLELSRIALEIARKQRLSSRIGLNCTPN